MFDAWKSEGESCVSGGPGPPALAVQAEAVHRRHGSLRAVAGVTLHVGVGRRHALVGPNGAGKTTLMRMISGTLAPHEGSLRVLGHDALASPRALKAQIGVVPQGMTYDNEITVHENLLAFGRYHGLSSPVASQRAEELLSAMALEGRAHAMPGALSGGMQRRLLIARALMNNPRLLLLDEPTTGLDPESRHLLWNALDERCAAGMALLFTTHYLEEVSRLCDGLTLLRAGRVEWQGSPAELLASTVPPYLSETERQDGGSVPVSTWETVGVSLFVGRRKRVFSHDAAELLAAVGDTSAVVRPSGLEDALDALNANRRRHREALPAAGVGQEVGRLGTPDDQGVRPVGPLSAATAGHRRVSAPSLVLALHVWRRNLMLFRKSYRTTIVPNFFEPVIMLMALGAGLGSYVSPQPLGTSYLSYVAPGLLAVTAMNGAVFEVTYNVFVRLHHARSYDATVTTPVEPPDIVLGEILWAMTRCFAYTTVFLGVLAACGQVTSPTALLVVPLLLPLGLVFACVGLLFTGAVTAINSYSYFYTLVLTPLTMLSGVFFPTDRLSGPLRAVAEISPLQHAVALARSLLTTGDAGAALSHLAYLLVLSAVLLPLALRTLQRRLLA